MINQRITIIAAVASFGVIGNNNSLIWRLPADLKRFKQLTFGHTIIMGRKTFESIGKPLPGRISFIISKNIDYKVDGCFTFTSLKSALKACADEAEVFIIGGGQIYQQAMELANRLYITEIHHLFEGDIFFPTIDLQIWSEVNRQDYQPHEKNIYLYSFVEYQKI